MKSIPTTGGKSLCRREITLGQLRQLAKSPGNGGEDVLDTYYGWRNDRAVSVMKGVGSAALTLFTAWLIPFLRTSTPRLQRGWCWDLRCSSLQLLLCGR